MFCANSVNSSDYAPERPELWQDLHKVRMRLKSLL